jgi:hypothetical protein
MTVQIKNLKKKIFKLLPKRVSLTYIDYRDSIEDHGVINKVVKENDLSPIWDAYDDCFMDQQWDSVKYILDELISDIQNKFDIDEQEAEEIVERYNEELKDKIYSLDDSDWVKDLLNNTGDQVFFYDTGLTMPGYGESPGTYRLARMEIKKCMGIVGDKYDRRIDLMIDQASYGGNLVVYFNSGIRELICDDEIDFTTINFKDPVIAIIDNMNGSGDDTELNGHSFKIPFNRSNLFMDRAVSYSYTYDVCGMSSNWCNGTTVFLTKENTNDVVTPSSINNYASLQDEYNKTFKEGGCTFGDIKFSRHRNVTYINNYPCGHKCNDCGTFWID